MEFKPGVVVIAGCEARRRLAEQSLEEAFKENAVTHSQPGKLNSHTFVRHNATYASACTLPPGTSKTSISLAPMGGGLELEMNKPRIPRVCTRETSCPPPPYHATYIP